MRSGIPPTTTATMSLLARGEYAVDVTEPTLTWLKSAEKRRMEDQPYNRSRDRN